MRTVAGRECEYIYLHGFGYEREKSNTCSTFGNGLHNHITCTRKIHVHVCHCQNEMVMRNISRVPVNVMSTDFNVQIHPFWGEYGIIMM